ncbi:YhcH/YjgK/YiaL family protein, partial [bacterium]|nr:YhcH/YjgK/YiaL family protein [bacterium]
MIIDQIERWEHYHFGSAWKIAFKFLQSLAAKSDDKTYTLRGDDIFAQVTSYETRSTESAALETHRKYIDIQTILTGEEKIETTSRDGLVVKI